MIEYKFILGYLAILVAFVSYVVYFKQIFSGKTKPHAFSWFVWSLTTGIVFIAQIVKHGGAGAWVTGFTALACLAIFASALFKGNRKFVKLDWIFLGSALLSLLLWWLTKEPMLSVILLTLTDMLASLSTLRKSYYKPHEESATFFSFSSLKFLIAIFALESFTLTVWLYPTSLIITNALIVLVLLIRRQQLKDLTIQKI